MRKLLELSRWLVWPESLNRKWDISPSHPGSKTPCLPLLEVDWCLDLSFTSSPFFSVVDILDFVIAQVKNGKADANLRIWLWTENHHLQDQGPTSQHHSVPAVTHPFREASPPWWGSTSRAPAGCRKPRQTHQHLCACLTKVDQQLDLGPTSPPPFPVRFRFDVRFGHFNPWKHPSFRHIWPRLCCWHLVVLPSPHSLLGVYSGSRWQLRCWVRRIESHRHPSSPTPWIHPHNTYVPVVYPVCNACSVEHGEDVHF